MKHTNTQARLKELMQARNMRQVDILNLAKPFCERYDVKLNKSDLSQYVSGKTEPNQDKLAVLGMALDVSESWLMGFDVPMDRTVPVIPGGAYPYKPTRRIPILGRISAGLPLYAEQNIEGYTYTELNGGAEYFALRVTGDSMNLARINEGDLLIVRVQPTVENGQIAVVMVGDEDATVKRFYREDHEISLYPQSTNPDHKIQKYDLRKTTIKILGLVVEVKFKV